MFGNTFVLPRSGGDTTCIKINQDKYASEYLGKEATRETRIRIRHSKTKASGSEPVKDRHNVEVLTTYYATAEEAEYTTKAYFVLEARPQDSLVEDVDAIADWLIATANANILSLEAWES